MLAPKIDIDQSRCTTPFDCKKCLTACALAVFRVKPVNMKRGEETNKKAPGSYKLDVTFRDMCTGCLDCVKVCPNNALTITLPEEVAK